MGKFRSVAASLVVLATTIAGGVTIQSVSVAASGADPLRFEGTPLKVVVNQSYENIGWRIRGADVSRIESVDATLEHTATRETADFDFDSRASDGFNGTFRLYDWERMGRYTIYGQVYDDNYNKMRAASAHVTVKRQGRTFLTGTRNGQWLSLRMVAQRYDGGYPLWAANRGATIRLQRYVKGAWQNQSVRVVPSNGVLTWRYKMPKTSFRILTTETGSVWASNSKAFAR